MRGVRSVRELNPNFVRRVGHRRPSHGRFAGVQRGFQRILDLPDHAEGDTSVASGRSDMSMPQQAACTICELSHFASRAYAKRKHIERRHFNAGQRVIELRPE
jgi:hypothetical protein